MPLLWKLLTEVIAKDMYNDLEQKKLLPEEQEGSLGEKCPNTDFFSGPYLDTFYVVDVDKEAVEQRISYSLIRLC